MTGFLHAETELFAARLFLKSLYLWFCSVLSEEAGSWAEEAAMRGTI